MNNQTIEQLNNRKFEECYFSIICIPVKIYFNEEENVISKKDLYLFFGCTLQGVRKFISATISDNFTKVSDWYNYLMKWKDKGLNTILFACIHDNKVLKDALSLAFKEIEIFYSCFNAINKIFKYYTDSYSSNVTLLIKNIFLANSPDEFNLALSDFNQQFNDNAFILDLLANDFNNAYKYSSFNSLLKKHIFAFYFYRDTLKKSTVISHSKPYFSSIDEFVTLLIPLIIASETRMYSSKSEWVQVLNIIYSTKKDLIKCYL